MDIIGDVLKGIAVAGGSAVAGYCLRSALEYYRMSKFGKVFGKGVKRPSDLLISVPLWRALEGDRSIPRFVKADSFGARAEFYGPSEMYNADDMVAAAYVLNVIGNHFSEPVTYTNDAAKAEWNAKTVVVIGSPTSNYHARFYFDKFLAENPTAKFPSFVDINEDDTTGARAAIKLPDQEDLLYSSRVEDFGIVLKLPNLYGDDGRFSVFLIGGIHAPSTREAARIFNVLWSEKFNKRGLAGVVFRMDPGKEGTGKVVYECKREPWWLVGSWRASQRIGTKGPKRHAIGAGLEAGGT